MPAAPATIYGGSILVTPAALPGSAAPLKVSPTGQLTTGLDAADIPDLSATYATPSGVVSYVSANYQPLDADLTAIAALTGTNTIYYRSAADTWTGVVIGTGLDFSGGTLSCTVTTDDFTKAMACLGAM